MTNQRIAIIGAGPAGLAAADRLVHQNAEVILLEREKEVGGISKTVRHKGFCFDLGMHRYFTKSDVVNQLWSRTLGRNFITRDRLTRIYYRNRFFDYPIKPFNALRGLGFIESMRVIGSYAWSRFFPFSNEKTFEEWVSNRFGHRLYLHFFKSYTEKVWGIPAHEIQAEWAAQRIKSLSVTALIKNAFFPHRNTVKTLIDSFQYPIDGSGMMYEQIASNVQNTNVQLKLNAEVVEIQHCEGLIQSVITADPSAQKTEWRVNWLLSSMPLTDLVFCLSPKAPDSVVAAAKQLKYRSFISVSIILKSDVLFPDTWLYVHCPDVRLGRIQNVWKNSSMESNRGMVALGLEYFCMEGDQFWNKPDAELIEIGLAELEQIGLGRKNTFVDGFVIRVPKAYPVYDGDYPKNIQIVRSYIDTFLNLQPMGRYGMFKYNNMDHSILTGIYAAEKALGDRTRNIWEVNTDQDYHEEQK